MELLDIISAVHDLSQIGAEFNEEIQNLNLTVMTLAAALENIRKKKRDKKFDNIYKLHTQVLTEQLTTAKDLLQSVNEK